MQLCDLIERLKELEEEVGPFLPVDMMQEGLNVQLESEVADVAVSTGKDGPSRIILIGHEED